MLSRNLIAIAMMSLDFIFVNNAQAESLSASAVNFY
jgi:hypothetical protein